MRARGKCSSPGGERIVKKVGPILFLLVALLLSTVHAAQVMSGIGAFSVTVISAETTLADGILIIDESFTLSFTGFLVGTTLATATVVINLSTGGGVFHGMQTFTGTANGVSGTLQTSFSAEVTGFTEFRGQFVILTGSGGLSNLQGRGTIAGIVNVSGTYSGFFVFA